MMKDMFLKETQVCLKTCGVLTNNSFSNKLMFTIVFKNLSNKKKLTIKKFTKKQ